MKKQEDKPYMDAPKKSTPEVKEQLLFGNTPSIKEKKKKDKKYQDNTLNEGK